MMELKLRWMGSLLLAAFGVIGMSEAMHAQSPFVRGDVNGDGVVDISDAIGNLAFQFDGVPVDCLSALDLDDSGDLTIGDPILALSFLFSLGADPASPFPGCGLDPTPDGLGCLGPVAACAQLSSIDSPADGANVGSSFIDVLGSLGGLSGPNLSVEVNGVAATLLGNPADSYELKNLALVPGSNTIEVVVFSDGSAIDNAQVTVNYTVLSANNLTIDNGFVYTALGGPGVAVMSTATREFVVLPSAPGTGSVDDVAVADDLLFTLDAASPGALTVYSLSDPANPMQVSGPVAVPVGPFAGVSASAGRVSVSGGTSLMTVRSYTPTGTLSTAVSSIDLGIGQPDVLQSDDGSIAYVSTDFAGTADGVGFGITMVQLADPPGALASLDQIGLPGAGFSGGFASPANFPIESALLQNGLLLTAHGGGLTSINPNTGNIVDTVPFGFSPVNVDVAGMTAFVVGTGRSLAEVDYTLPAMPVVVETMTFPGGGSFTSVAADSTVVALAPSVGGVLVMSR